MPDLETGSNGFAAAPVSHELTLGSLRSELQDAAVSCDERMSDVIERLRRDAACVGVMVQKGSRLLGIISREMLARDLAKPFYRELCERRPVYEFLRLAAQSLLELPMSAGISEAVEAALGRPVHERYEPIVVLAEDQRRLILDVPVLLTAQCRALNATLRALEAQRAATERAESERQRLHEQLVVASRQAGRAEVATGVLHNVGNVLNSVNVCASVIARTIEQSKVPSLSKAVGLLRDNSSNLVPFLTEDDRGRRLPGYLEKLSSFLAADQASVADEIRALAQGLEHIKHIVQMQQSHATDARVTVPVRPADLFEAALNVNLVSFERHNVAIEREIDDVPQVLLDKHKVLQILINLISNAKSAVKQQQRPGRKITVAVEFDQAAQRVRFRVSDNGVGIAAENLTRIFSHGFTTWREGHGFGLHTSANAAREMGGTLSAQSEGPGHGATFILDLPVSQLEVAQ